MLRLLDRYALITYDQRAEPRAVRIHALTARAVRESLTADELARAAGAAAALLEVWPDILWDPDGRPVLFRAGTSLLDTGLAAPAITY